MTDIISDQRILHAVDISACPWGICTSRARLDGKSATRMSQCSLRVGPWSVSSTSEPLHRQYSRKDFTRKSEEKRDKLVNIENSKRLIFVRADRDASSQTTRKLCKLSGGYLEQSLLSLTMSVGPPPSRRPWLLLALHNCPALVVLARKQASRTKPLPLPTDNIIPPFVASVGN